MFCSFLEEQKRRKGIGGGGLFLPQAGSIFKVCLIYIPGALLVLATVLFMFGGGGKKGGDEKKWPWSSNNKPSTSKGTSGDKSGQSGSQVPSSWATARGSDDEDEPHIFTGAEPTTSSVGAGFVPTRINRSDFKNDDDYEEAVKREKKRREQAKQDKKDQEQLLIMVRSSENRPESLTRVGTGRVIEIMMPLMQNNRVMQEVDRINQEFNLKRPTEEEKELRRQANKLTELGKIMERVGRLKRTQVLDDNGNPTDRTSWRFIGDSRIEITNPADLQRLRPHLEEDDERRRREEPDWRRIEAMHIRDKEEWERKRVEDERLRKEEEERNRKEEEEYERKRRKAEKNKRQKDNKKVERGGSGYLDDGGVDLDTARETGQWVPGGENDSPLQEEPVREQNQGQVNIRNTKSCRQHGVADLRAAGGNLPAREEGIRWVLGNSSGSEAEDRSNIFSRAFRSPTNRDSSESPTPVPSEESSMDRLNRAEKQIRLYRDMKRDLIVALDEGKMFVSHPNFENDQTIAYLSPLGLRIFQDFKEVMEKTVSSIFQTDLTRRFATDYVLHTLREFKEHIKEKGEFKFSEREKKYFGVFANFIDFDLLEKETPRIIQMVEKFIAELPSLKAPKIFHFELASKIVDEASKIGVLKGFTDESDSDVEAAYKGLEGYEAKAEAKAKRTEDLKAQAVVLLRLYIEIKECEIMIDFFESMVEGQRWFIRTQEKQGRE